MLPQTKAAKIGGAVTLALAANALHLSSSYIVKTRVTVNAGEVLAARSVIQVAVFGVWSIIHFLRSSSDTEQNGNTSVKSLAAAVVANGLLVYTTLACFMAVKLMPISDYVVLCFTSPIATLIITACCCCLIK